ncbi:MAG: long-chain fatty acid--CoA ligase [Myxococcales bacterium]|nr:long-chain fatty acid--CoA ligase [Myxococcales bacterium]
MANFDGAANAREAETFIQAFHRMAEAVPERLALRTSDGAMEVRWGEVRQRADAIAGGLEKLGVAHGETVALMLGNRPEFHIADLAVMTAGATPFSIYQTLPPESIEYVVGDADARVAIIERAFYEPFMKARQNLPKLEHVILIDGEGEQGTIGLSEIEGSNPGFDVEASVARVTPEHLITLIYTSGTTGPPKGVQLTHANLIAAVRILNQVIEVPDEARVISWLPTAHIAERAANYYIPLAFGASITTLDDPRNIIQVLPDVRPSFFFAVPRIWEKMKAGIEAQLEQLPEENRDLAKKAIAAGVQRVRLEQAGQEVPEALASVCARADEELFSKLRALLGLQDAMAINTGAAPTPVDVLEFFHAIGLELAEVWGMSETTGAGTTNPPGRVRIGTVGPPAPEIEVKLDTDGEVLIRGPILMQGYRNLPDKTAETFTEDGWLRTGDIGEFDEHGYLSIVDRKKELIINAAGKNMSPANIESKLKGASPFIGQACTIGDARPYNTALIVLDADYVPAWAEQNEIAETSLDALAENEKVVAAVEEGVAAANEQLSRVEQIKKFHIVRGDWLPGGDELTPTMKLKRKPIAEKYAREIEALYAK